MQVVLYLEFVTWYSALVKTFNLVKMLSCFESAIKIYRNTELQI